MVCRFYQKQTSAGLIDEETGHHGKQNQPHPVGEGRVQCGKESRNGGGNQSNQPVITGEGGMEFARPFPWNETEDPRPIEGEG